MSINTLDMYCVQPFQSFFESHPLLEYYEGVLSIENWWSWNWMIGRWGTNWIWWTVRLKHHPQRKTTSWDQVLNNYSVRCGCLPLEIATGHYHSPKTPLSKRVCQLCNSGIGTETQFLLCPSLDTPREDLTKSMVHIYPHCSPQTAKRYGSYKPVQHPQQWVHQCTIWGVIYWGDQTLQLLYLLMYSLPSFSHPLTSPCTHTLGTPTHNWFMYQASLHTLHRVKKKIYICDDKRRHFALNANFW